VTTADVQQMLTPSRTGQGTAIEQSRAIAEVQAVIIVAQRCPRNVPQSISDMRESCRRKELADRAFYRYPQGGQIVTGPSIHLARELARVWGNFQYGLTELRRDDDYGQSEMLAFAWDVQTNTRNSSIVINPHKGYTGGRDLTDLRAIYENNTNVGARRVREAILAVLPTWFVEEAKDICNRTLSDGGGLPLPQRIANAIELFGNMGITVPQLETKLGMPSAKWTDQDLAQLRVIRQSLLRGEISKDEEFPPADAKVTVAEIIGGGPAAPNGNAAQSASDEPAAGPQAEGDGPNRNPGSAPKGSLTALQALLQSRFGFKRNDRGAVSICGQIVGRELDGPHDGHALANLSEVEAIKLLDTLEGIEDLAALAGMINVDTLEGGLFPPGDGHG